jgi:stage II sporulation protein GA (sporulation sigma-E factor processing peptidase)
VYYEIYIDVLFVINLFADYLLLRLVNRLLKCSATCFRSLLGALTGAAGFCLMLAVSAFRWPCCWHLSHILFSIVTVRIGCKIRGKKLFQGVIGWYVLAFLLGGMLQALLEQPKIRAWTGEMLMGDAPFYVAARTFISLSIISYLLILAGFRLYGLLQGKVSNIADVDIYIGDTCKKVKGLYDTGNRLYDTYTGAPISILEYDVIKSLLSEEEEQEMARMMAMGEGGEHILSFHPHYVLFHSVGKEQGLLLAVTLKQLCIYKDGLQQRVPDPIVALSAKPLSHTGHFQMIIHPDNISGQKTPFLPGI